MEETIGIFRFLTNKKHKSERIFTALASEKALAKYWFSEEDEQVWKDL